MEYHDESICFFKFEGSHDGTWWLSWGNTMFEKAYVNANPCHVVNICVTLDMFLSKRLEFNGYVIVINDAQYKHVIDHIKNMTSFNMHLDSNRGLSHFIKDHSINESQLAINRAKELIKARENPNDAKCVQVPMPIPNTSQSSLDLTEQIIPKQALLIKALICQLGNPTDQVKHYASVILDSQRRRGHPIAITADDTCDLLEDFIKSDLF
ncbi:Hypothetical protein MVR_LOCUS405 [uncultured virus]|nr:Hypothetical protein MVR_LOCUS405 [uncultured virus]